MGGVEDCWSTYKNAKALFHTLCPFRGSGVCPQKNLKVCVSVIEMSILNVPFKMVSLKPVYMTVMGDNTFVSDYIQFKYLLLLHIQS